MGRSGSEDSTNSTGSQGQRSPLLLTFELVKFPSASYTAHGQTTHTIHPPLTPKKNKKLPKLTKSAYKCRDLLSFTGVNSIWTDGKLKSSVHTLD